MQIYIESHWYFHYILHNINDIQYIINLFTSCDILKITLYINLPIISPINSLSSTDAKFIYPPTQILSLNTNHILTILNVLLLLTEDHINNCIKSVANGMDILLSLQKLILFSYIIMQIVILS